MTVSRSRWIAKKAARKVASMLPERTPAGLRALTYHAFRDDVRDPFSVGPGTFERQIAAIAASGLALSPSETAEFVGGRGFPGRVLVTIDDGVDSVAKSALPILNRHGVGAMLFVVADWIGRPGHMDRAAVRAAADDGFVIGSHSCSHPVVAREAPAAQHREIVGSRDRIADIAGRPVCSFAYPYGTRFAFNEDTRRLVEEAGYTLAFTTQHGSVTADSDRLELPRIKVEGGDDAALFRALCRGRLDKWRFVDRALAALQSPEPGRSPTVA